jgi:hypothetical protein
MIEVIGVVILLAIGFGGGVLFGRRNAEKAKTFDDWFVTNRDKIIEKVKNEMQNTKKD